MKKAFLLGVAGSFFFAFTFVLNRSMNLAGGSWVWSGCLRFFFSLPLLALIARKKQGFRKTHAAIARQPGAWLLWSTVGFGLFYAPLCLAASFGEAWLIAASWQITIVMGVLTAPLFGGRIPLRNLGAAGLILVGVCLLQLKNAGTLETNRILSTLLPITLAALAYPLGNRKMMQLCGEELSTLERTYGMTLCSLPFWLGLAFYGGLTDGLPAPTQLLQSFCVALFSGVIATLLFFKATDMVQSSQKALAVVESTQSGEVVFALLGGVLLLGDPLPDIWGFAGLLLIIFGMSLNSLLSAKIKTKARRD